MHKIDGPGATGEQRFTEGDPVIPIHATDVTADWLNMVQDELEAVCAAGGLALEKKDNTQVLQAIRKLLATAVTGFIPESNATSAATENTVVLRDANARAKIANPSADTDIANKKYVDDAVAASTPSMGKQPFGDIRLMPFRYNGLPGGWYYCNGDQYALTSAVGLALSALAATFKSDWGITVSGSNISLPNMFYSDGRGYFLRAVNGTTRQVGGVETDAIQNITGYIQNKHDSLFYANQSNGAFYSGGSTGTRGNGGGGDCTNIFYFDASRQVRTASENRSLNVGTTPAIFLGV